MFWYKSSGGLPPRLAAADRPLKVPDGFEVRLVATALPRVGRRAAEHLSPVGGQPLHVLRVLTGMGERVVELGIGQAAGVVRGGRVR